MNLLEFVEQSLAKGDSTVRHLKEDMDPKTYDIVMNAFQNLEENPFLISTDEVIDIDDIVGTTKDVALKFFESNTKWKEKVAETIINGEFDNKTNYNVTYKQWEDWINCDDTNEEFLAYITKQDGMDLIKYKNKYYVEGGHKNIIFAKILGQDIPYFPSRRIYDLDKFLEG